MDTAAILATIDEEIQRLEQARDILTGVPNATAPKRSPGRPKGVKVASTRKKRVLSAEARAKIAAAQKKRWAAKSQSA